MTDLALRRAVTVPLSVPQLFTSAKSFEDNFLIGSRTLNRWGLHRARLGLAHRLAETRRRRLADAVAPEDRAAFARDGYVARRDFLPRAQFEALTAQIAAYRCTVREKFEGDTKLRKITVTKAVLTRLPELRALLANAEWRRLIAYVGASEEAPAVYLQSVLRHARDAEPDPQTFVHADTFHPTVKAWLFLTDVPEDEGAFSYVPGSHRLTPARLDWEQEKSLEAARSTDRETREGSFRIEIDELARLGLPQPRVLGVPANTLIVADTFGFHARGPSVRPSLRVEVWAIGRRAPFIPWAAIDEPIAGAWLRAADNGWQPREATAFDPD
jgi:hypothetical protein